MATPIRLVGPAFMGTTAGTVYTVPAYSITRVLQLWFSNRSLEPIRIRVSIGGDDTATRILDYDMPGNEVLAISCLHVLVAAEVLQAWCSKADRVVFAFSGDLTVVGG